MRLRRLPAVVGLGAREVWGRLTGPRAGRTRAAVAGVAAAIAVLVVVTGLSLGLATSGTVASDGVNYWIVPDQQGVGSTPLAYEGASLGAVHETSARIAADDRVAYATPVAIQVLRLDPPDGDRTYVLALGVVADDGPRTVAGIDTSALTPGDPFYANGSYDGEWTGDLIASPGVEDQLGVPVGTELSVPKSDRTFTLRAVANGNVDAGAGTIPVVVVHLAELQTVTNTSAGDQADQILVSTPDPGVRERLSGVYPQTSVQTRSGFSQLSPQATSLSFAMAVAAGLVALGIGTMFVATMMGLELTATRESLAVLGAIGFGRSTLLVLVVVETLAVAVLGGIVGVVVGLVGIVGLNLVAAGSFDVAGAAVLDPLLVPYGLAAAVVVALLSVVYPAYVAWRTNPLEELTR